jgi:hypothetical protein
MLCRNPNIDVAYGYSGVERLGVAFEARRGRQRESGFWQPSFEYVHPGASDRRNVIGMPKHGIAALGDRELHEFSRRPL